MWGFLRDALRQVISSTLLDRVGLYERDWPRNDMFYTSDAREVPEIVAYPF